MAVGLSPMLQVPEVSMDDLVYMALTIAFFAATFGLVHLFERMRAP
jgi:hypothetical protein